MSGTEPQSGEYWRVCADPNPELGVVLEVQGKCADVDLLTGEAIYRVYLTPNRNLGTELVKRSWLRERREEGAVYYVDGVKQNREK